MSSSVPTIDEILEVIQDAEALYEDYPGNPVIATSEVATNTDRFVMVWSTALNN